MTIEMMLNEGLFLMLTGMGFVVVFLTVLVLLLNLMSKLLPEQVDDKPLLTASVKQKDNRTLTAVLTAAVHHYRTQNQPKD